MKCDFCMKDEENKTELCELLLVGQSSFIAAKRPGTDFEMSATFLEKGGEQNEPVRQFFVLHEMAKKTETQDKRGNPLNGGLHWLLDVRRGLYSDFIFVHTCSIKAFLHLQKMMRFFCPKKLADRNFFYFMCYFLQSGFHIEISCRSLPVRLGSPCQVAGNWSKLALHWVLEWLI